MLSKNLFFLLFFPFFTLHSQIKAEDLLGNWMATDNSVAVKVYEVNKVYRAKVLWFDENLGSKKPMSSRYDTANPDPQLQKRKIIGMEILEGLKFNTQTSSWEEGKIYDASSGRHWDSSITFAKDGTIKVRGYWKVKWIGKTLSFRRLNPETFKKL
jgi:uncharacterized protein (DUF2147 family)